MHPHADHASTSLPTMSVEQYSSALSQMRLESDKQMPPSGCDLDEGVHRITNVDERGNIKCT